MATLLQNDDDSISFVNFQAGEDPKSAPTLLVQAGDWDFADDGFATGFTFLVTGAVTPLLTPSDARKLAKWLARAADFLDGTKTNNAKKNRKRHYDDDDDDENLSSYNFR